MTEIEQSEAPNRRRRRILTFPNLAFVLTSIAVFVIVAYLIQTNIGAVIAAVTASTAGAVVWWASTSAESHDRMAKVLVNLPILGAVPPHAPLPAPSLTDSGASGAYADIANALEGKTHGRVLLISSAEPGQGASTVAMNVAISAARSGRRIVLIDGDADHPSVSRFMSSGPSPGITEIAAGKSTLTDASRLWSLGESSMLPVIPSGKPTEDLASLGGINVSDAIESIADHADFVLIDAPPALSSAATEHLANHADGTILVITDAADPGIVADAGSKLSEIGAPILGYVTVRANTLLMPLAMLWKPFTLRVAVGSMLLLGALTAITGAQLLDSWNSIERVDFALSEAGTILSDAGSTTPTTSVGPPTTVASVSQPSTTSATVVASLDEAYETILLIGGDEDSGASDVILYLVMPANGVDPFIMSFPRDLYVDNPCTGGQSRINSLSHGCKDKGINGGTLLSVQISEMTGIDVDHFAEFTFDGFVDIIDAVDGIEICVGEYPVRDLPDALLELPAGCTLATGTQALSWVRSRHTQILKDGTWRRMPGTSDLMRNTHQQDVMFELALKLKDFESPQQLTQTVASVAGAFTLSDTLTVSDAISLAWSLRGIDVENINRIVIPVRLSRSPTNQSILISTLTAKEVIAEMYGDTLPFGRG